MYATYQRENSPSNGAKQQLSNITQASQSSSSQSAIETKSSQNKNPFTPTGSNQSLAGQSGFTAIDSKNYDGSLLKNWFFRNPNYKHDPFFDQKVNDQHQTQDAQNTLMSKFNYHTTAQGNIVWACASILAYQDFKRHHLRGKPLSFYDLKQGTENTLFALNNCEFSKSAISQSSIYIKSGTGRNIVQQINRQVLEKFPFKTTPPLDEQNIDGFVSYAYLFKGLTYEHQFERLPGILWFGKHPTQPQKDPYMVEAFGAKERECFEQIKIIDYESNQKFFIGFKSKNLSPKMNSDAKQIQDKNTKSWWEYIRSFFVKEQEKMNQGNSANVIYILGYDKNSNETIDEVVKRVMDAQNKMPIDQRPSNQNLVQFSMPVIDLDITHQYEEFKGLQIKNVNLRGQKLIMVENIKLRMDQKGVVVENDAFMGKDQCAISGNIQINIQNPFWLVLTEEGKHPYLVAKINYLPQKILNDMW